ncbi:MAG TPA: inositol monophosphatase family protein [Candidatus Limnocylindrales bacterium]
MIDAAFGADWSASLSRASDGELADWLAFCHQTCDLADEIAMSAFRSAAVRVDRKADGSFVTEADRTIERLIRDRVAERFPTHGIVGEEYGSAEAGGGERWYVDPIDGTHNFMRGLPLFGTLLAIERDGEVQAGMISAPALGQRWWASRGRGAWVIGGPNGSTEPRRLTVSDVTDLGDAQVLFRSIRDMEASRVADGFVRLVHRAWRERGFGDFWGYTLVSDGVAEAMLEQDLYPWDLAAPWIVVEEAGGRITDFDGRRSFERGEALATNGRLHQAVLATLHDAEGGTGEEG